VISEHERLVASWPIAGGDKPLPYETDRTPTGEEQCITK
jgi:hypothetical protein